MEVLNEAGVLVFQEEAVGAWIWLLLLLPGIFIAGAVHMLLQSKPGPTSGDGSPRKFDPHARGFALGVLFLSAVFLPLPWVAEKSYQGLRFEFDEAAGIVRVSDGRSPDVYATPFTGFRGLILTRETASRNDDGSSPKTTYELILARITGPGYALLRTGDRERALELANRLSHMLRVTTVTDFESALAFVRTAPNTAARMPTPAECGVAPADGRPAAGSASAGDASIERPVGLRKRYVNDDQGEACLLEYPMSVPPLIWSGILLGFAGLYWLTYLARARGINWKLVLGFVAAIAVTAAFTWIVARDFRATGVVSFQAPAVPAKDGTASPELRVWTRSWLFGRLGESHLPLRDVRVVQASISARESSFYIYDRNPLAFSGLADAFDTARNLRSMELRLDGLPVVERLRLADVLATGLAW